MLRLRWPWLALGLYLGATLGVVAASGGAGYQATSVLQVAAATQESSRVSQLAQSTQLLGRSAAVLTRAARATDVRVRDLNARARVQWEDGTDLVRVTVRADTPGTAVAEANAIADSIVEVSRSRAEDRLDELRAEGQRVLEEDGLSDEDAERSRRGALGSAVAEQQDDAILSGSVVSLLDPAAQGREAGISRVVAGALGGVGGLALASAVAVVFGTRRRRITSPRELALLMPDLANRAPRVAEEQAGRLLDTGAAAMVVLCMPEAEEAGRELAARIVRAVHAHGFGATVVDALETPRGSTAVDPLTVLRRGADSEPVDASARVLVCAADDRSLEVIAGQRRLSTVIVAAPKRSTLGELQYVAAAVATTSPTVVIWS